MKFLKNSLYVIFSLIFVLALGTGVCFCLDYNKTVVLAETSQNENNKYVETALTKMGFVKVAGVDNKFELNGNIEIENEYVYDFGLGIDLDSVIIDGKGYTITCTSNLFNTIKNSKIYNLKINYEGTLISAMPESLVLFPEKTSYGVLANVIEDGSIIDGCSITANTNFVFYKDGNISHFNYGLIAGSVNNSTISQVKIYNSVIQSYIEDVNLVINTKTYEGTASLMTHSNIGLVAGSIDGGTILENNLILDSSINLKLNDDLKDYNIGAMVGLVQSGGRISNNFIKFSEKNSDGSYIEFENISLGEIKNFNINYGNIAGLTKIASTKIVNNIIDCSGFSYEFKNVSLNYFGDMVGYYNYELNNQNFSNNYCYTPRKIKIIGNIEDSTFDDSYNVSYLNNKGLISSYLNDNEKWDVTNYWNTQTIWKLDEVNNLLVLQLFETFSAKFDKVQSVASLNLSTQPTDKDSLLLAEFSITNSFTGNEIVEFNSVSYNDTVYLKVLITEAHNYSKFFEIKGLMLNGEQIYDVVDGNLYPESYNITSTNVEHGVVFSINEFKSNNMGTYSVLLKTKETGITVKVYKETEDADPAGYIKTTEATDGEESKQIGLVYGKNYVYETVNVNPDYNKAVDWYLFIPSNETPVFNLEVLDSATKLNSEKSKTLQWVFKEKTSDNTNSFYLDEDENLIDLSEAVIYAVFEKIVEEVEIYFELDSGDRISSKIATVEIYQQGGREPLKDVIYDEDKKCYIAKLKYDTDYVITLKSLNKKYVFVKWSTSVENELTATDNFSGALNIQKLKNSKNTIMCNVFKTKTVSNLIWLWIGLGALAVIGVVVLIILIVKKKKNKTNGSYKKYMY